MKSNSFNLCHDCLHRYNCVLTDQKDKVFSCSEYDKENPIKFPVEEVTNAEILQIEQCEDKNIAFQVAG